jgi:transposase
LRNWSYYALKEKISYKAEKAGIAIIVEWFFLWGCLYSRRVR